MSEETMEMLMEQLAATEALTECYLEQSECLVNHEEPVEPFELALAV